jgi:hypothetical protein
MPHRQPGTTEKRRSITRPEIMKRLLTPSMKVVRWTVLESRRFRLPSGTPGLALTHAACRHKRKTRALRYHDGTPSAGMFWYWP